MYSKWKPNLNSVYFHIFHFWFLNVEWYAECNCVCHLGILSLIFHISWNLRQFVIQENLRLQYIKFIFFFPLYSISNTKWYLMRFLLECTKSIPAQIYQKTKTQIQQSTMLSFCYRKDFIKNHFKINISTEWAVECNQCTTKCMCCIFIICMKC